MSILNQQNLSDYDLLRKSILVDQKLKNFIDQFYDSNKVILIGSSQSSKLGNFGKYVDNCNCPVIRTNYKELDPLLYNNYGSRTDLILSYYIWDKYKNQYSISRGMYSKDVQSLVIKNFYKKKNIRFTTGYMSLIFCMLFFDYIELLGYGTSFGFQKSKFRVGVNKQFDKFKKHDIRFEDSLIDLYIHKYKGKIIRIEETYTEYLN